MAKAKKKIGVIDFVVLGVLVVCLVLSIVGLTIDQWTTTEEVFGETMDVPFSEYSDAVVEKNEAKDEINNALGDDIMGGLDDMFGDSELVQDAKAEEAKLDAMVAFGYITVILVAGSKCSSKPACSVSSCWSRACSPSSPVCLQ